eukprot:6288223-Prymnesium_polylepis.1
MRACSLRRSKPSSPLISGHRSRFLDSCRRGPSRWCGPDVSYWPERPVYTNWTILERHVASKLHLSGSCTRLSSRCRCRYSARRNVVHVPSGRARCPARVTHRFRTGRCELRLSGATATWTIPVLEPLVCARNDGRRCAARGSAIHLPGQDRRRHQLHHVAPTRASAAAQQQQPPIKVMHTGLLQSFQPSSCLAGWYTQLDKRSFTPSVSEALRPPYGNVLVVHLPTMQRLKDAAIDWCSYPPARSIPLASLGVEPGAPSSCNRSALDGATKSTCDELCDCLGRPRVLALCIQAPEHIERGDDGLRATALLQCPPPPRPASLRTRALSGPETDARARSSSDHRPSCIWNSGWTVCKNWRARRIVSACALCRPEEQTPVSYTHLRAHETLMNL